MAKTPVILLTALAFASSSPLIAAKDNTPGEPPVRGPNKSDAVEQYPAAEGTQKWEYLYVNLFAYKDREQRYKTALFINKEYWLQRDGLEYLGNLGWELVTVYDYAYIFKRPKK
jgi:hypothetical protein